MSQCPTVAKRIQLRHDTLVNWALANTLLLPGEFGYESDTGRMKVGNGYTRWNLLPYFDGGISAAIGPTGPTGPTGPSGDVGPTGTASGVLLDCGKHDTDMTQVPTLELGGVTGPKDTSVGQTLIYAFMI